MGIQFEIRTSDDEDAAGFLLATACWPTLPRVGETVILDNIASRDEREDAREENREPVVEGQSFVFVVDDVVYRYDTNGNERSFEVGSIPDIEVWVHEVGAPFGPARSRR